MKKTIYWIIGIIVLLLLVNQGRKFGLEDDFLTYDDFSVEENIFNVINQWDLSYTNCPAGCTIPGTTQIGDITCTQNVISDYLSERICENDVWELVNKRGSGEQTSFALDIINKYVTILGTDERPPYAKTIKNFFGNDVKAIITQGIYCPSSGGTKTDNYGAYTRLTFFINDAQIYTDIVSFGGNTICYGIHDKVYNIEVMSSRLNPNNINIYVNGQLIQEKTLSTNELYLKVSSSSRSSGSASAEFRLNKIKYRIPFSCVQQPGDLLAIETFAGGQAIDINDLRFPVKSFCLAHPVIITSPDGSTTSAEPYQVLITGQPVTIPADQTWSFFYVFDNSGQIVRTCPSGNAYDPANDYCRDVHGLVQVCSEGVFDPAYGSCVIYPAVKEICDIGRWDIEKQACVWNPPVLEICDTGTWSAELNACVWHPDVKAVCSQGEFNPDNSLCEYTPIVQGTCTQGTYDSVHKICVYAPDVTQICTKGKWDAQKKLCVWNPPIIIDQPEPDEGIVVEPEPTSPIVYILIGGIIFMAFIALRQKGYLRFKR